MWTKDPAAVLDYQVDWTAWLNGDTITTATWAVTPAGSTPLTVASSTNTTTVAKVWLTGGAVGTTYQATNHIVTTGGRTDERTFRVQVRER